MPKILSKFIKIFCIFLILAGALAGVSRASDKEDELFFVAQKAFEDGFYDVALGYLNKFLKDFPETTKRPQVNLLIGQCYFFDNQYLKAFDVFQSLLNSPEADQIKDAVLFWMGEAYLKGKDYKQAQNFYQQLIREYPKSTYLAQAYYSLGWTFFEEGLFQESQDAFRKLIEGFKQSDLLEDASFKIGECLYNLKEYEKSQKQFNAYSKDYPRSSKLDMAYFYIAESGYYLEDYETALEGYGKVLTLSSDDKLKGLAKTSSGWSFLKLSKYDEALKNFNEAEAICKEKGLPCDDILLGKGNLFSELEQYDKALGFYETLIEDYPNSNRLGDAYLGKASALYSLGKFRESAAMYSAILKNFSQDNNQDLREKAYFGLAWANSKLGLLKEAIESFKFVADNSQDKLMRLSAFCQMADAYQDSASLAQALDIYDRILRDYPDSPYADYAQYQEGLVLLKMDRLDAATIMFQSLKANFPKSKFIPEAQYYLGAAYFKKGDFAACVDQFGSAIKVLPKDNELRPEAMFNLGLSYTHLERYKEANDIFERVAADYPLSNDLIQRAEFEIANTMFSQGKAKEALKKFKILIYKYPQTKVSLQALDWLGDYYLKDKQYDVAIKYFKEIADQFTDTGSVSAAHYKMGKAFLEMGKLPEAAKELGQVSPDSPRQLMAETKIASGLLTSKTDLKAAVKVYEGILKDYPEFVKSTYIKLAQVYKNANDPDKAVGALQAALTQAADSLTEIADSQLQFDIADLQEAKGDLNRAVEGYLKIPYLYPQENNLVVKSYLRVARIFEDKNNWKEAKQIYEKVASRDIDEAKFARERIEWINKNFK